MLNKRSKQHSLLHFLIEKLDQTGFPHSFALVYNEKYNESYISKLHHHEKMTRFMTIFKNFKDQSERFMTKRFYDYI